VLANTTLLFYSTVYIIIKMPLYRT